jgi:hypothetical protein
MVKFIYLNLVILPNATFKFYHRKEFVKDRETYREGMTIKCAIPTEAQLKF